MHEKHLTGESSGVEGVEEALCAAEALAKHARKHVALLKEQLKLAKKAHKLAKRALREVYASGAPRDRAEVEDASLVEVSDTEDDAAEEEALGPSVELMPVPEGVAQGAAALESEASAANPRAKRHKPKRAKPRRATASQSASDLDASPVSADDLPLSP